jgi:hypothetical protein
MLIPISGNEPCIEDILWSKHKNGASVKILVRRPRKPRLVRRQLAEWVRGLKDMKRNKCLITEAEMDVFE